MFTSAPREAHYKILCAASTIPNSSFLTPNFYSKALRALSALHIHTSSTIPSLKERHAFYMHGLGEHVHWLYFFERVA